MPFVEPVTQPQGPLGRLPDFPEPETPDFFSETLPAAFATDNPIGAALNAEPGRDPEGFRRRLEISERPEILDFDPFADLEPEFQPFARAFTTDNTPADVARTKRQIEREQEHRRTLDAAGFGGFAAAMVAGTLDPVVLIPVGGIAARSATLGRSLLDGGLRTARAGFIAGTAAELALQGTQETRTLTESAINVTASTFLSGLLGAAAPAIARGVKGGFAKLAGRVERDLRARPEGEPDPIEPGFVELSADDLAADTSAGAQQVRRTTMAEESLKKALGVEKITFASPMLRAATSPSIETRRIAQDLAETPFSYEKNVLGQATPVAVETRIKFWDAPLADGITELERQFVIYRRRLTGKEPTLPRAQRLAIGAADVFGRRRRRKQSPADRRLTFAQFREQVGDAMRHGDQHDIPEVAATARLFRERIFDPLRDRAVKAKLLPERVLEADESAEESFSAFSYLTRVYDIERIKAKRPEFRKILVDWLRKEEPEVDELEIIDAADGIIDSIMGTPQGRIPYESMKIPRARGPLRERTLTINDDLIEEFLISDIELVARYYTRTMAADVEITRVFGEPVPDIPNSGPDMGPAIGKITDSYQRLFAKAPDDRTRKRLEKRMRDDIRDIEAMRDRLRGTFGRPENPDAFYVRASRVMRDVNYTRLLGGVMINSIPDIGRVVMVNGLARTFGSGLAPLVTNLRKAKLAAKETKLAGTALDMVLDTRALSIADIGDEFGRHSRFERGTRSLANSFGLISLMSPWNAALKQWSGMITGSRIIDTSIALAAGKARKADIEKLAIGGIDRFKAEKIAAMFKAHGDETAGLRVANTLAWTDREAIEAFRAALQKDVDRIIVTPGVGDRPLWMSKELGKVIGQFRSFAFASAQRVLLSGLQQRDAAALNGLAVMIGLGATVYYLKASLANRETSDDPAVWLSEAVDRSGVTGWLYDLNGILEKGSRGTVGVSALTGGPTLSRYAVRNTVGAVLGPTFGLGESFFKVTGAAASGEVQRSDIRALRRLLPFQNVFYMRALLDMAQEGAAEEVEAAR